MNDHDFHDLDARAGAAATDLRAAAGSRPRPAFDPERSSSMPLAASGGASSSRSAPRRTLAAVAAVLVLVAGGVIWAAARPDDDRPSPVTTTTDAPRPFVLGSLPDGFSLAGAGEVTDADWSAMSSTAAPLVIYGPAPDQPEVGITVLEGFDASDLGEGADSFEFDGVTAYALDDQGLGRHVVVLPVGANAVVALSPTLERDELVRLLADVRIDGRSASLGEGAVPAGWSELGREPSVMGLGSAVAAGRGSVGPGAFVAYSTGDVTTIDSSGAVRFVLVSSMSGDEARLHALELVATETDRATVRGHEAIVGTTWMEGGSGQVTNSFVTWIERPGELIRISASGVPLAELVGIAEAVEPIGAEGWRDLVERSQLGEFDTGDTGSSSGAPVEMDRGRFDDGTAWVLRVQPADGEDATGPNASIDLQVALGGDSSSGSSSGSGTVIGSDGEPSAAALGSSTTLQQEGRTFGAGFVGEDVATVSIRRADGSEVDTALLVVGGGRRAWLAEATDEVVEVVALAADGTELGRLAFGREGDGSAPGSPSPTTMISGGP